MLSQNLTPPICSVHTFMYLGEKTRLEFHDSKLISDRTWLGQRFSKTFICSEAVDYFVKHLSFPSRELAIQGLQMLQVNSVLRTLQSSTFSDDDTLGRFLRDEDFCRFENDLMLVLRAKNIEDQLCERSNGILTVFHEDESGEPFFAFLGAAVLDWLTSENLTKDRAEGVALCRKFYQSSIIKSLDEKHPFQDSPKLYYRFNPNFISEECLLDVVRKVVAEQLQRSRKVSETDCNFNQRTTGNVSPPTQAPVSSSPGARSPVAIIEMFKDSKELFVKKTIKIDSDSVGYGFVVRGNAPSFVQTIDPEGPAARSGLKVGHIVQAVNGVDVLGMTHRETAKVILGKKLGTITVTVLQPPSLS